jgi:hypothetical protein
MQLARFSAFIILMSLILCGCNSRRFYSGIPRTYQYCVIDTPFVDYRNRAKSALAPYFEVVEASEVRSKHLEGQTINVHITGDIGLFGASCDINIHAFVKGGNSDELGQRIVSCNGHAGSFWSGWEDAYERAMIQLDGAAAMLSEKVRTGQSVNEIPMTTNDTVPSPTRRLIIRASPAHQDGLHVNDLRLEVGVGSVMNYDAEYRYTAGANSLSSSGTYKFHNYTGNSPMLVSIMYEGGQLDPFGFIWGLGAESSFSKSSAVGETFKTMLLGVKSRGGFGFSPAENWRLEATAEIHLGIVDGQDADIAQNGFIDRAEVSGSYHAFGGQISIGYLLSDHVEIGLSGGLLRYSAETHATFDYTGGSYTSDESFRLSSIAATIGHRF